MEEVSTVSTVAASNVAATGQAGGRRTKTGPRPGGERVARLRPLVARRARTEVPDRLLLLLECFLYPMLLLTLLYGLSTLVTGLIALLPQVHLP